MQSLTIEVVSIAARQGYSVTRQVVCFKAIAWCYSHYPCSHKRCHSPMWTEIIVCVCVCVCVFMLLTHMSDTDLFIFLF